MSLIEIGSPAPLFALPDQHGRPHVLKDYRGHPVVLYFYPKDDTSGCTKEACAFRDLWPRFQKAGSAVVLGVSPDSVASHERFADKYELPFPLLADVLVTTDEAPNAKGMPKVCAQYGVWQDKSMYGRTYQGVVRTTYLIDEHGIVAQRWDRVSVPGHADVVLAAIGALAAPSSR